MSDTSSQLANVREQALRVDLAAAFRLAVEFDWHESVGNYFSAALSDDGKRFLMNSRWRHFTKIRASDLLLLDADDPDVMNGPEASDTSALEDPWQHPPCREVRITGGYADGAGPSERLAPGEENSPIAAMVGWKTSTPKPH